MTPVFIVFLAITLIGSIWLLIDRRRYFKSEEGDDAFISGTGTFIAVNLLLVLATVFIFIGTTVPLFSSIVPAKSYFNVVNLPIFLMAILLAGFCILVGWRKPDLGKLSRQLLWPAAGAVLLLIILVIFHVTVWYALVPFLILAAVVIATLMKWGNDVAARMHGKEEGVFPAFGGLFAADRSRYGGYIIHIAIAVLALGIIGSSALKSQTQGVLNVGDTITLGGYTLTYNGFTYSTTQKSENVVWMTAVADMNVSHNGEAEGTIHPTQVLQFTYSGETVTDMSMVSNTVAIRSNLAQDYYVIFEDFDPTTNEGTVAVLINPLVEWIWIGGILLLIGGLVSFSATPRKLIASRDKELPASNK
jgi:cytochrome c-type biogenesis protein CcmF